MNDLPRRIRYLTRAWNRACPEKSVSVEWAEEYVYAGLWLQACAQVCASDQEVFAATLRRLEFTHLLQRAGTLLDELDRLVAAVF